MTDRREHIGTNNRLKIKQLCDNKKGSYTLTYPSRSTFFFFLRFNNSLTE